jgi:thioesterase domain-containing protein
MSVIEACNSHEKSGFVVDVQATPEPQRDMADQTTDKASPPRSDAARAALWTGILGAAKHIGKRAPLPARQRPTIVQLRAGTAATPVYFIGAGLYELHTAQLLPPQHSIFAAEIAWPAEWHDASARNDTAATPVLEDLVVPFVTALHAHVGATVGAAPCVLAGYSFHSSMAFEIAHQLLGKGVEVALVMLLDAPAEYPLPHRVAWKNLCGVWLPRPRAAQNRQSLGSRLATSFAIARWAAAVAGRYVGRRFAQSALNDPGELTTKLDTLGRPMYWPLIERLYDNSLRAYKLRRLDCRGVLFRADRSEDCPSANADVSLGWDGLFSHGLDIVQVSGDHFTMMREPPHDRELAQAMSDVLDRHCAKPSQDATQTATA